MTVQIGNILSGDSPATFNRRGDEYGAQPVAAGRGLSEGSADAADRLRPRVGARPAAGIRPARRTRTGPPDDRTRSEAHTSELQSLMRISYAGFCLKTKKKQIQ